MVLEGQLVTPIGGHDAQCCRTQAEVVVTPSEARLLLTRPLGNHMIVAAGHAAATLLEYCRLFTDATVVMVGN